MAKRKSWAARLEAAEKRGRFLSDDRRLAANFTTCAIGERHDWQYFEDMSSAEMTLGLKFYEELILQHIPEAKRIYAEIQGLS